MQVRNIAHAPHRPVYRRECKYMERSRYNVILLHPVYDASLTNYEGAAYYIYFIR